MWRPCRRFGKGGGESRHDSDGSEAKRSAPDARVSEAERAHFFGVEKIATVKEERTQHALFHGEPWEGLKVEPVGEQEDGICAIGDILGLLDHVSAGDERSGFLHRLRIMRENLGTLGDELLNDGYGDAAADVIGVTFEGETQHPDFFLA